MKQIDNTQKSHSYCSTSAVNNASYSNEEEREMIGRRGVTTGSVTLARLLIVIFVALICCAHTATARVVAAAGAPRDDYEIAAQTERAAAAVARDHHENALFMLKNYLKTLRAPAEPYEALDGEFNNDYPVGGYLLIEDFKSNKRGVGPRPLRFGR